MESGATMRRQLAARVVGPTSPEQLTHSGPQRVASLHTGLARRLLTSNYTQVSPASAGPRPGRCTMCHDRRPPSDSRPGKPQPKPPQVSGHNTRTHGPPPCWAQGRTAWQSPSRPVRSLRIGEGRGGPQTSRHALYPAAISHVDPRCPEGHFGGNQLPGGSMGLSPLCQDPTRDLHVSIDTAFHTAFALLRPPLA